MNVAVHRLLCVGGLSDDQRPHFVPMLEVFMFMVAIWIDCYPVCAIQRYAAWTHVSDHAFFNVGLTISPNAMLHANSLADF
jgi:hypothetical protein